MTTPTRLSRRIANRILPVLLLGLLASPASGEPVTSVQISGDSSNRLDIVFLGDGYTASEMAEYASDVQTFLAQLFAEAPFGAYRPYFNVHRIEVVSAESGADKPPEGIFRNTALGAFYYCSNIERLICVDNFAVNSVLVRSVNVNQRDLVVILVNDAKYGGSGGQWAISSLHAQSAEIARHEIGHTLGLLADEYVDTQITCNTAVEPIEPNVTTRTDRAQIKWSAWIAGSTPIPTTTPALGIPGLYEGGKYCPAGMYRPTFDSKMRSLGRPFEQINTEQLVKRFYNFVSPIDDASPSGSQITIQRGFTFVFSVTMLRPDSHALRVVWEIDAAEAGSEPQFSLNTAALVPGAHTVRVTVEDPTALVRNDPAGILSESRSWGVTIQEAAQSIQAEPDGSGAVSVTWYDIPGPSPTDWMALYAPGTPHTAYLTWIYTSCSATPGAAAGSGTCSMTIPSTVTPGIYEVRLFAHGEFALIGTSNTFAVTGPGGGGGPSVTVNPSTIAGGGTVIASWSGIVSPTAHDWMALYAPGTADTAYIDWMYVSCIQAPIAPSPSGSCSFPVPSSLPAGTYELRLFANGGSGVYTRLAVSAPFTITAGGSNATVSVAPSAITPGGAVTVSWSGIAAPTSNDWFALYTPGAPDTAYLDWVYVSCTKTPGDLAPSGSCSFVTPFTIAPGPYEVRLFSNGGTGNYLWLATSNQIISN